MSARPKTAAAAKSKSKAAPADPITTLTAQLHSTQSQLLQAQLEHTAQAHKLQQNAALIQEQNHTITVLRDELKEADQRLKSIYSDLVLKHSQHSDAADQRFKAVEQEKLKLCAELSALHDVHRVELEGKQNIIDTLQCEIADLKVRMNDMVAQFSGMLKQTLEKMNEKIVVSNQHMINDSDSADKVVSYADYSIVGKQHTFEYKEQDHTDQYQLHT